jgi:hypothetical protein
VEVGIVAGLSLLATNEVSLDQISPATTIDAPSRRYAAGAFIEWRFHPSLSVEGSFLVRRFGHADITVLPNGSFGESIAASAWEVPFLLKWRPVSIRTGRFVIGAGAAFRRVSNVDWVVHSPGAGPHRLDGSFLGDASPLGVAVSGGIEFRVQAVRLRPELRYLRFERPLYDWAAVKARQDSMHLVVAIGWPAIGRDLH